MDYCDLCEDYHDDLPYPPIKRDPPKSSADVWSPYGHNEKRPGVRWYPIPVMTPYFSLWSDANGCRLITFNQDMSMRAGESIEIDIGEYGRILTTI